MTFKSERGYRNHVAKMHPDEIANLQVLCFQCTCCLISLSSKAALKKHTFKIHRKEDQKVIETRKNRRMEANIKRLREDNIMLKIVFDDLKKGQFYEPLNSVRSDKEME